MTDDNDEVWVWEERLDSHDAFVEAFATAIPQWDACAAEMRAHGASEAEIRHYLLETIGLVMDF